MIRSIGLAVVAVAVWSAVLFVGVVAGVTAQELISVLLLAVLAGLAVLIAAVLRSGGHPVVERPQPVAQPVVSPAKVVADNSFEDAQPLPVINDYRRQPAQPPQCNPGVTGPVRDDVLQPLTTAAQPAATASNGAAQPAAAVSVAYPAIGLTWPEMVQLQASPETAVTVESGDDAGALLPRREPTLTDYPLIWEVVQGTKSQNLAIRELWGTKDGRTHGWITRVRDFYLHRPAIEHNKAGIICWEVQGTRDTLVVVAARLEVTLADVEAAVREADLVRCRECETWVSELDLDEIGVCESCGL